MTRPVYETRFDRERAQHVIRALGWEGEETPQLTGHDWQAVRIKDREYQVEVKVRRKRYDTYMISKAKLDYLLKLPDPVLVVGWQDVRAVGAVALGKAEYTVGEGGRRDRGDAKDVEPCAFIPIGKFKQQRIAEWLWWVLDYVNEEQRQVS